MKSIAILAGMGLLLLLGAVLGHEQPAVEIQNRSGETVEALSLWVDADSVAGGKLPAGALDRHLVPIRHEGPLRLELRFASGQRARFDAGWFNPGQEDPARIAILSPDSVILHAW